MAYVARSSDFHGAAPYKAAVPALATSHRGFWRRLLDQILDSRQREAQRAVDRYVAWHGTLTDSMEREIADRLIHNRF